MDHLETRHSLGRLTGPADLPIDVAQKFFGVISFNVEYNKRKFPFNPKK